MKLPRGRLVRSRVVDDLGTALSTVLDRELTGYARLEPPDSLLLDADGAGILTFEDGVPVVAYHTGTDNGGAEALADIAVAGPHRVDLHELDSSSLAAVHDTDPFRVPPTMPAEQLVGDRDLVERTSEATPDGRRDESRPGGLGAVESFLADEDRIESIRDRARTEAKTRADEWGFDVVESE